ncbi:hypothetical protein [Brevundimonas sp. NPDC058933]
MILIDPPSPFAPKSDWRAFLDEMEALAKEHPDDESVKEHIEEAREALAA